MPHTDSPASREYGASPYRWLILGLLSFSYLLVYVHRMCPAVLAQDLMQSFDTSAAVTGLMASAYFFPYALMQAPGGILADKLGARRLITLCMLVATLGSVLFAVSGSVNAAFWSRVLVGLGLSAVLVPSYKALTYWFPARQFVMGASVIIAIAGLGGVVASSPLAWLSELIGWRSSFMALAGLTFVNGLLIWFLVRDKPTDMGLPRVEPQVSQGTGKTKAAMPVKKSLSLALGSLDFWLLAVWFFFNGGILFSFAGLWAGPYFMGAYGMTKTQAAGVIDLFSFGWVFGPLIFAWIAARFPSRSKVLGLSMTGLGLVCLWLILRNGHMSQMELYLFALSFGFLGAGPAGVCFTAAKERYPVEMAGTVTGLVYVFPMAGSAVFQPLAGVILDMSGHMDSGLTSQDFIPLFILYAVISFVAGLAGFVFRTDRGKKIPKEPTKEMA